MATTQQRLDALERWRLQQIDWNRRIEARLTSDEARIATLEQPAAPVPTTDPPGWRRVFHDDFATWDPSRYFVYPATWKINNSTGWWGAPITVADSKLRIGLHTDASGIPRGAAFCPISEGSLPHPQGGTRGDLANGIRIEYGALRADRLVGYKGVPLLWARDAKENADLLRLGEIDGPEGNLEATPAAFMHYTNATSYSDQKWLPYPAGTSWQDAHDYVTEWVPGQYVEYFLDGKPIGPRVTERVPTAPFHPVGQFEPRLGTVRPDPLVSGYVELGHLTVWTRA
jgi:hypothetical protein